MKFEKYFFVIIFIIFLLPLVSMPFFKEQPNYEKRPLAEMPTFLEEGNLNKDFFTEFEAYFNDHFGMRPYLITTNAYLYDLFFNESPDSEVIVGKEDWLFMAETADDYTGENELSSIETHNLVKTLSLCDEYVNGLGKQFIFTIAPNKNSIYPQYMPKRYQGLSNQRPIVILEDELENTNISYVSLLDELENASLESDVPIYFKRDSHWNNIGSLVGYQAIMGEISEHMPFEYDDYENATYIPVQNFSGDIESMHTPALGILDTQYEFDIEEQYSSKKPIMRFDEVEISTTAPVESPHVLMFRDSFANGLIPFMSNNLEKVDYSRSVPYNFVRAEDYDVVVLEIVERNIKEIIKRTPVLPAPKRKLPENIVSVKRPSNMTVNGVLKNEMVYITGALPNDVPAGAYDIYVETYINGNREVFEAFPIYETENPEETGFSLYINDRPSDDIVSVYFVSDDGSYIFENTKIVFE